MAKKPHEFGKCMHHTRRWAVVKLQGNAVCMECFERQMAGIGTLLRGFQSAVSAGNAGSVTVSVVRTDG